MEPNLIKVDVNIKCVADMIRELANGNILIKKSDQSSLAIRNDKIEFSNGKLYPLSIAESICLRESMATEWESYKEVFWHDNLPEHGIICRVSYPFEDSESDCLQFINKYEKGKNYPFIAVNGNAFGKATPIPKDELLKHCIE